MKQTGDIRWSTGDLTKRHEAADVRQETCNRDRRREKGDIKH